MKRAFDNTITEDMITESSENELKKRREDNNLSSSVELMDYCDKPSTSADDISFFKAVQQQGHASLVEREANPTGYSLVNAEYVGKKDLGLLTDLEACYGNAVEFSQANVRNKLDLIGQQMKYLQNTLSSVINKAKRDGDLHSAACNFVKKSDHTYHLYERPSGQKYFSMLSPIDWNGNPPHTFLGSWFLEADQSWTPAEEMHLRYPGITFLKQMYMGKKSIQ